MSDELVPEYGGSPDKDPGDTAGKPHFARELPDALCEDLTDLLMELQLIRRRQPSAQVDRHVRTVRDVLVAVRRLVCELRQGEPFEGNPARTTLEREVGIVVTRQGEARGTDD